MSDGYRSGRDDGQRRFLEGGRERQPYGRDRWSERNGYGTEQRSFDDEDAGFRPGRERYGARQANRPQETGSPRGRGIIDGNPQVDRVARGDFEPGFYERFGGEHRGKGPKNYTRSDERIKEDVNDRLADDAWLDASEIEVAVKDGEVTLSGTVRSREDKRRAEDLVEDVSGVKHVQCNLRAQSQTPRSDEAQLRAPGATPGRPAGTA
jgi:hypothetical protein